MEPAKIDWKRIDSRFVVDSVYEHINAPNWVDFLSPEPQDAINDQDWFCRPDCNHPKTAEDFLNTTPTSNSKLQRSAGVSQVSPLKDWNQGDANLKRRGLRHSPNNISDMDPKFSEDSENQKPSLWTPPNHQANSFKAAAAAAIKSSSEKKKLLVDDKSESDEVGGLKSTVSARNLFGSRDILNHITEFCNELKKLATRVRERENEEEKAAAVVKEAPPPPPPRRKILGEITETEVKEKKLLVDGNAKDKPRRNKRGDDAENIPISVNLEKVKHKGEERLLQSRTNPPSPQCFSAPSSKASTRSKLMMERGVLEEVKQNKDEGVATVSSSPPPIIDGRQARALDVFWFLKPCTLSD